MYLGRLDYQINEVLDNHKDPDCGYKYDFVRNEVWFSNPELMNDVAEHFNLKLTLETFIEVPKGLHNKIWKYIDQYKKYTGTYGAKYLNPM